MFALEPGKVVAIEDFTGPKAGFPWWLDTQAVLVEGASGVICYGEISTQLLVGVEVTEGDIVGYIARVLKNDKGLPTCMLHFELYEHGTTHSVVWNLEEQCPKGLLNPTSLLNTARKCDEERISSGR